MQELINRAKSLLESGEVSRVLGWKKGETEFDMEPAFFSTAEELDSFIYNGFCGANLSKYMIEAGKKEGKTLVVTVAAKTNAKVELVLENCTYLKNDDEKKLLTNVISKFQMSTDYKGMVFGGFIKGGELPSKISDDFRGPIEEILKLAR